jgi:ABC-type phosphate/phosphonate transport system ATPase subunit
MDSSALVINNLTKTYSNGLKALHGINLEIPHGDFFAFSVQMVLENQQQSE